MKRNSRAIKVTQRLEESPTRSSLIRLINPNNNSIIELDDMVNPKQKSILSRLPPSLRSHCQALFYEFILNSKSFKMPTSKFLELYNAHPRQEIPLEDPPFLESQVSFFSSDEEKVGPIYTSIEAPNKKSKHARAESVPRAPKAPSHEVSVIEPVRKAVPVALSNARSLSRERNFIRYDEDFINDVKSTAEYETPLVLRKEIVRTERCKSVTPEKRNESKYSDLQMKRKQEEEKLKKKFSSPTKRTDEKPRVSPLVSTFKSVYPDSERLISIRQTHLKSTLT